MSLVPGALVHARGEAWMVARAESFDRGSLLTLEGRGRGNAGRRLRLLTPFDRIEAPRRAARPRRRRRDVVGRVVLTALASVRHARGVWTAASANMTQLSWQLEPALAVLGGASRVLLADAVGLGKTLQAGLIAAELRARGLADRILVLAPAGLRRAWAAEWADRLGLQLAVFDQDALLDAQAASPAGVNPWATTPLIVSSIDLVKRADVRAGVEAVAFDLLIVDEAHHLTPGSDRGALVARLAARIPWLVLVSATPHAGDERAFAFLSGLGAVGTADRLTIFRRGRDAAGLDANRSTCALPVTPTAAERALIEGVHEYARRLWRAAGDRDSALALVAATLARRAASSALAIERTLARRVALIGGAAAPAAEWQAPLPWDELDDSDDAGRPEWLAAPGPDDAAAERAWLLQLIDLARAARGGASKIARLRSLLGRVAEPIVVFTEFRDTLTAVLDGLGPPPGTEVIHGGLDPRARADAIARFTHGGARLLVATDAAGEGLNLHRRCRIVVTMEWPWSPLRLEQRVGRVDRLGQQRRVHAIHLFHRGTVEDTVLARLLRRRHCAEQALGELVGEQQIAEAVFTPAFAPVDNPELRRGKPAHRAPAHRAPAHRAPAHRAPAPRTPHPAPAHRAAAPAHRAAAPTHPVLAPSWTPPRRPARHVITIVEITRISSTGCIVDRTVRAFCVALASVPATRREWQRLVDRLAADAAVLAGAAGAGGDQSPRWGEVIRRIAGMRSGLRAPAPRLVQSSLFDERAVRAAAADRGVIERLDDHLARRAAQLEDEERPARPASADVRLIAAWPYVPPPDSAR